MESMMRNRELTETRMMQVIRFSNACKIPIIFYVPFICIVVGIIKLLLLQALREELASVERRAEEERAAHNATKLVRDLYCLVLVFMHLTLLFNDYVIRRAGFYGKRSGIGA